MPSLIVKTPDNGPRRIPLTGDHLRLGRGTGNDVEIEGDASVSRTHAEVRRRGPGFTILDLGSTHGTRVNGERIAGEVAIHPGDRILLGSTEIVFTFEESVAETWDLAEDPSGIDMGTVVLPVSSTIASSLLLPREELAGSITDTARLHARAFSILSRGAPALLARQSLEATLEAILSMVFEASSPDRGAILLLEGHPAALRMRAGRASGGRGAAAIRPSRTLAERAIREEKAILTRNTQIDAGGGSDSILVEDIRSAMCVPLWNENRVIGLIYADSQGGTPRFNEGDLEVLTLLGHLAAITIENGRLFEKDRRAEAELAAAAEIQKRLLPAAPPVLTGYEMSGANRPSQGVGGDYYDFVPRAEDHLAVAIGDVCGHGLASALLMGTAQAAFRVLTASAAPVPVLLARLNDIICDNAGDGRFVTFFCGDLDAASGRFSYGNAGHNPPLLLRASGAVERLAAREIVLGVRRAIAYTAREVILERGDLLVLYTDGITETRSPGGEEFGEERLLAAVQGCREAPLDAIRDRVFEEAATFALAATPEDDLTLALIRRT